MLWFSFYQINHNSDKTQPKLNSVSYRMKLEFLEANKDVSLVHPKFGNFLNLNWSYLEFP